MNKKLHRVEVVLYVMAEDEFDACWAATNVPFDVFECVAEEAKSLDPGWEEAVPYNSDDDRTCAEILASKRQTAATVANTIKPPFCWAADTALPRSTDLRLAHAIRGQHLSDSQGGGEAKREGQARMD
jgi:hypothetical protein